MSLGGAIEKTIKMAEKHKIKLTAGELEERLLSAKIYREKEIRNQLRILNYKLRIRKKTNRKLNLARKLANKYLLSFGDILMVGVTGSVAAGEPGKNDDIDIMIITRKNRLWLTRLYLKWIIWKNKIPHRRYGQKERGDEFCFNLWLDETGLKLPREKRTIQSAVDLIMMKPILNREKTYEKFLMINGWAKKYVATGYQKLITNYQLRIINYKKRDNVLISMLNCLAFGGQYLYMRPKMRGEIVTLEQAFFHPVV